MTSVMYFKPKKEPNIHLAVNDGTEEEKVFYLSFCMELNDKSLVFNKSKKNLSFPLPPSLFWILKLPGR